MEKTPIDARALHERCVVFDAHSDFLSDVVPKRKQGRTGVIEEDWVPVMRAGGIDTRLATIFVDHAHVPDFALRDGLDTAVALHKEVEESPSVVRIETFEEIEKGKQDRRIGLILGMEGAEPLGNDLELLRAFRILGLRLLTLTHALRNYCADGVHFFPQREGTIGGLTDFGVKVVEECNELGIVVDVSHLNETGFWDVLKFTKAPLVASHSNCRALMDHPRCLTDEQIKALIASGGVIGMNAASIFVDAEKPDLDHFVNHIDHIMDLGGEKNIGLGFDFCDYALKYLDPDTVAKLPNVAPVEGLCGDQDVPNLTQVLVERGYSEEQIELILGKNMLRVFKEVWK
ncbi:MAG: dipeptidase [bacterium]